MPKKKPTPKIDEFFKFLVENKVFTVGATNGIKEDPKAISGVFDNDVIHKQIDAYSDETLLSSFEVLRTEAIVEFKEVYGGVETTTNVDEEPEGSLGSIGSQLDGALDTLEDTLKDPMLAMIDRQIDRAHKETLDAVSHSRLIQAQHACRVLKTSRDDYLTVLTDEQLKSNAVVAFIKRTDEKLASASNLVDALEEELSKSSLKNVGDILDNETSDSFWDLNDEIQEAIAVAGIIGVGLGVCVTLVVQAILD
jgi:hypothetical protein